jgi:DNA-binding response OmpR family regulator
MINEKNILIIDDDVETSLKYQKWLEAEQEEEEGFNLTLINDPELTEQNFKTGNYDLVLIDFRMSIVSGFDLYYKLQEISKKTDNISKRFRIGFMTASRINYKVLAEIHPEFGEECYVCKKVEKEVFIKRVYSLIHTFI